MKNLSLLLTISVFVFLSTSMTTTAQGRGAGASNGQGHDDSVSHDHDQVKAVSDAKVDHDSHTNWQTKFNERLQDHPESALRITKLLPAGTDLTTAESGFKSSGQFIAALHVSKNLGIPFNQLKAAVTGLNAQGQSVSTPMSLGKAIHELKPTLTEDQVKDAVKQADKQASHDTEKTESASN